MGDKGIISNGDNVLRVLDTKKLAGGQYVCECHIESGEFYVNDNVTAQVDEELRRATARNHTCAHLLQAALRKVLGDHVHQSGSYVDPYKCRFDFSHFSAMTLEEITQVEKLVNEEILKAVPVVTEELPIEEAQKRGAMALFGEKYGKIVRVVTVPDFSTEFCGGTHVSNSGQIGLFKITGESSVAAGVRRITAVTGTNLLANYQASEALIKFSAAALKTGISDVKEKIESLVADNKAKDKEIQALNAEITKFKSADMFSKPVDVNGLEVYIAKLDGTTPDALRSMGDDLKNKADNVVGVIAGVNGEKASIVAVCGKGAIARGVKAGDVVREVAKLAGGGGGGRPDSAMAGAKDISKLDDALNSACDIIKGFMA